MPVNRTRLYRNGALVAENFPVGEMRERLAEGPAAAGWIDLCDPVTEDLHRMAADFGLHGLAVQNATQKAQRAKLDEFDTHLFLNTYVVRLPPPGGLTAAAMAAFITPQLLITVRDANGIDINALLARWDADRELAGHGVAFLVYGLLDTIVDNHFEATRQLDDTLDSLDDLVFEQPSRSHQESQRRIFQARRDLVRLRQYALPMREVVNALMRPSMHTVDAGILPYYQDVYDHVLRVVEWTESLRDLVTTTLDASLMTQSNHLNVIVKQVTSWAAIIAVPAAITGFFGQNVRFPWQHTTEGLLLSLGTTLGFALVLFVVFRRRGWL